MRVEETVADSMRRNSNDCTHRRKLTPPCRAKSNLIKTKIINKKFQFGILEVDMVLKLRRHFGKLVALLQWF